MEQSERPKSNEGAKVSNIRVRLAQYVLLELAGNW